MDKLYDLYSKYDLMMGEYFEEQGWKGIYLSFFLTAEVAGRLILLLQEAIK